MTTPNGLATTHIYAHHWCGGARPLIPAGGQSWAPPRHGAAAPLVLKRGTGATAGLRRPPSAGIPAPCFPGSVGSSSGPTAGRHLDHCSRTALERRATIASARAVVAVQALADERVGVDAGSGERIHQTNASPRRPLSARAVVVPIRPFRLDTTRRLRTVVQKVHSHGRCRCTRFHEVVVPPPPPAKPYTTGFEKGFKGLSRPAPAVAPGTRPHPTSQTASFARLI